jgi:phage virion morphogenesis protein
MNPSDLKARLDRQMNELVTFATRDVPDIVGIEATNYFKESFEKEEFDNKKWQEVQRRIPGSPWYGRSSQSGKFSQKRATDPILKGETDELKNAITPHTEADKVIISNDKPYAAVHNFGLKAKIFGKQEFTMPKRTFMAVTDELMTRINTKIKNELTKILKK